MCQRSGGSVVECHVGSVVVVRFGVFGEGDSAVVEVGSEFVGEADSAFVQAHSAVEKAAVEEYPVEEVDSAFEEAKIVV